MSAAHFNAAASAAAALAGGTSCKRMLPQQRSSASGSNSSSGGGGGGCRGAARTQRGVLTRAAAPQGEEGGLGEGLRRMAQRIGASLPVIGLVSRLTATEGGIGNDVLAYPEYCRQVFDAAPQGFQVAVVDLQARHGKAAQRRYVLLVLWMARQGAGVVPGKAIVDAARRLRVSQDVEFEMDRFGEALGEVTARYTYMERPRGALAQQADVAVDALARLVLGLKDGTPVPEGDAELLLEAAAGGFYDVPGFRAEAERSLAERGQRERAYAA